MSLESKEALLHGQMQECLLLKLMESPAVSGHWIIRACV